MKLEKRGGRSALGKALEMASDSARPVEPDMAGLWRELDRRGARSGARGPSVFGGRWRPKRSPAAIGLAAACCLAVVGAGLGFLDWSVWPWTKAAPHGQATGFTEDSDLEADMVSLVAAVYDSTGF